MKNRNRDTREDCRNDMSLPKRASAASHQGEEESLEEGSRLEERSVLVSAIIGLDMH
jgi:hypothetical protein